MDVNMNKANSPQQIHSRDDEALILSVRQGASDNLQEEPTPQNNQNVFTLDPSTQNKTQMVTSQAFVGIATLANKLPTGTVLAFQMLAPIFNNQGECTLVNRVLVWVLIGVCLLSILVLNFTDSVKDENNNVAYGFVTKNGLWMIDYKVKLPPTLAADYRLNLLDFLHAFMAIILFITITMLDSNTVKCFAPKPSTDVKQLLKALPIGSGVLCSLLFLWFPTQRNGIGFPSPNSVTK